MIILFGRWLFWCIIILLALLVACLPGLAWAQRPGADRTERLLLLDERLPRMNPTATLMVAPESPVAPVPFSLRPVGRYGGRVGGMAVQGDLAVIGIEQRIHVADVSDPLHPRILGISEMMPAAIKNVALQGSLAYVLWYGEVVRSGSTADGFCVVDISDTTHPRLLGSVSLGSDYNSWPARAFIPMGDTVLIAHNDVVLMDVSDPNAPFVAAKLKDGQGNGDVASDGQSVYALQTPLCVFDISDPQYPALLRTADINGRAIELYNSTLHVVGDDGLLRRYTISDTTELVLEAVLALGTGGSGELDSVLDLYRVGDLLLILRSNDLAIVKSTQGQPMTLVSISPLTGLANGLRYVQARHGNIVYIADSGRMVYVDISDPATPMQVGSWEQQGGDLAVRDDLVFMAGPSGLLVLDTHDPGDIRLVARCDGIGPGKSIILDDDLAYVSTSNGLSIIDISEPTRPISMSFVSGWPDGQVDGLPPGPLAIHNGYVYGLGSQQLYVVDARNPATPTWQNEVPLPYRYLDWCEECSLSVVSQRLYATRRDYWGVLDLANPSRPRMLYQEPDSHLGHISTIRGGYMAQTGAGVTLHDVANLAAVRQLWGIPSLGQALWLDDEYLIAGVSTGITVYALDAQGMPGASARFDIRSRNTPLAVAREGDLIYLLSRASHGNYQDLHIIRIEAATSQVALPLIMRFAEARGPEWHIRGQVGGATMAVEAHDGLAAIGVGPRLAILDVTDPGNMRLLGQTALLPGLVQDVALQGDFAYLALGDQGGMAGGLAVVNISDPEVPTCIGQWLSPNASAAVAISGTVACLVEGTKGLVTLDVTDPARPRLLARVPAGNAYDVALYGHHAYLGTVEEDLIVYNLRDPALPICTYHQEDQAVGVDVLGDQLYSVTSNRLIIYDLSDPAYPHRHDSLGEGGAHVVAQDGYAIVTSGWEYPYKIEIIDIGNPQAPRTLYGFDGEAKWIGPTAIYSNTLFCATRQSGLVAVDIRAPGNPQQVGTYNVLGDTYSIAISENGETAFVGYPLTVVSQPGSLVQVDISELAEPVVTDSDRNLDTRSLGFHIATRDGLVYVASVVGLSIRASGQLSTPLGAYIFKETNYGSSILLDGNYAQLVRDEWTTFDVSDPTQPILVGAYDIGLSDEHTRALEVDQRQVSILYANTEYEANLVYRVDASEPTDPRLVSKHYSGGPSNDLALVPGYALYANPQQGLAVADVSDPALPRIIKIHPLDSPVRYVSVVGQEVHVSTDAGVTVIDAMALPALRVVGGYVTPGEARTVLPAGNALVVGDGLGGLLIVERTGE